MNLIFLLNCMELLEICLMFRNSFFVPRDSFQTLILNIKFELSLLDQFISHLSFFGSKMLEN